jgi:hypothetical protein
LLANSCINFINSIYDYISVFALEICLICPPTIPSLGMFISLDLMLLLNMIESSVNPLSGTPLSGCKSYVEIKQESLAQLSLAIARCSLVLYVDLWIIFVLILNLVTTFDCYPSLYSNGVMSSR